MFIVVCLMPFGGFLVPKNLHKTFDLASPRKGLLECWLQALLKVISFGLLTQGFAFLLEFSTSCKWDHKRSNIKQS